MTDYSKITALYSRLSVGDEDRDGGESNSISDTGTNPVPHFLHERPRAGNL